MTLTLLTGLLALITLLPLSKIPHGLVRGPAFGRQQWALLGAVLCAICLLTAAWWLAALAALLAAINLAYIAKFTPLWPLQSQSADAALRADTSRHLSILTSNVKQSNRAYTRLLDLTRDQDPDILITVETDAKWLAALAPLHATYPHRHEIPHDTGYGMAIFSRLPLSDITPRELVTKGVPSIRATVTLRHGADITLIVIHPEPPIAGHDTKGRDSEIALIGIEARDTPLPTIVTGDLNDVAWSTTTRRFQRLSGLLDPRVGRGFFNTFHAHIPPLRWPLDHLFHDADFRLLAMRRLPDIGSDHFPIRFDLALADTASGTTPAPVDTAEKDQVVKMIRDETARPRNPIGTDWEDD